MDIQRFPIQDAHLNDEQFAELLMGATPVAVQEHLKVCAQCADESERVAGAIGSFEQQSRLWAERRAASLPVIAAAPRPSVAWAGIFMRPQAWVAAALAVAVGIGVAISMHHQQSQQTATAVQQLGPASAPVQQQQTAQMEQPVSPVNPGAPHVTASKLKADNELLSAIDGELRADSTPANLYGLDVSSHTVRTRSSGRMSN